MYVRKVSVIADFLLPWPWIHYVYMALAQILFPDFKKLASVLADGTVMLLRHSIFIMGVILRLINAGRVIDCCKI